jgi:hypothetical protein
MEDYFTFFFCSLQWTETDRVFRFIDWVTETITLKEKLHLIIRQREEAIKQKPTAAGDFLKLRALLRQLPLETFSLSNRKWAAARTEIFLAFENVHYTYTYASSASSEPQKVEVPNGVKVFSLSLRRDLWQKCQKDGISLRLLEEMEKLFIGLNCIYGYGHEPLPLITGRFCLISNTDVEKKLRVVDFDYARHVEKIYRFNYLSTRLLAQLATPEKLHELNGDVDYKDLRDSSGQIKGAAIYLKNFSQSVIGRVAASLRPLVWSGTS